MPLQLYHWLEQANIPKFQQIYTHDLDVDSPDGQHIYCVLAVINKNKQPERHEIIVLVATQGKVYLVDRFHRKTDFQGPVGDVSITMLPDHIIHANITIDERTDSKSMFPPMAFVVDGKQRKPSNYKS